MTATYAATMFASSYVEEEQQFWYWILGAWFTILHFRKSRLMSSAAWIEASTIGLVLVLFGLTRRWNQTGQKYAGFPDLVSAVLTKRTGLLWSVVIGTYALISCGLSSRARLWHESAVIGALPITICVAAFTFKVAFTAADAPELLDGLPMIAPLLEITALFGLQLLARVAFAGILFTLVLSIYFMRPWKSPKDRLAFTFAFHDILSLFLVTQTRTTSIPIFLLFHVQLLLLHRQKFWSDISLATMSIMCQYSSFFMLGGSNSISSVDLSNAYNGISGYSVLAVGALTFVGNWAGPIWWASAICRLRSQQKRTSGANYFALLTLFTCISTSAMMLACMLLREHLFIWTVFSPKYLYTLAWVWHLLVNGGIILVMLGTL